MKFIEIIKKYIGLIIVLLIIFGIYSYNHWYVPYRNLQLGFVIVNSIDCPGDHSIKAHFGSMIYHVPGDPYYTRTNASNGECFDTTDHAVMQGFRASFGTPYTPASIHSLPPGSGYKGVQTPVAPASRDVYKGGRTPDGRFCTYGYNAGTGNCCDDSDYSCEVLDEAPRGATAVCVDGTYSVSQAPVYDCSTHGGLQTDSNFSPFAGSYSNN